MYLVNRGQSVVAESLFLLGACHTKENAWIDEICQFVGIVMYSAVSQTLL